jgi:hypothetical protein
MSEKGILGQVETRCVERKTSQSEQNADSSLGPENLRSITWP